jgi:hypothetical protein
MAEHNVVSHNHASRFRRALWSAFLGGVLGGVITAQGTALLIASDSFGISPWLFGMLVLLCAAAVTWIAHDRLHSRLRPFALVETLGGTAGVWIALMLLSPPVNRFAVTEPFVLDFIILATLAGVVVGAVIGLLAGIVIGLQSDELVDALLPWLWLLGGVIAGAGMVGLLLGARATYWTMLAPTFIPGGMLAGWIAQREYLRLGTTQEETTKTEVIE